MAVPVGHAAVERAGIAVKDQRQEIFVALPHGQFQKPRHRMPEVAGPVAVLPASELSAAAVAAGAAASASKRLRHRGPTEAGSERQASRISSTIHSLVPKPATPLSFDTTGPLS